MSPKAHTIEKATTKDLPAMAGLLKFLFTLEEDFSPDKKKQMSGIEAILKQPEFGSIFVLKQDGETIGMTSILFTISTAMGGKVGILEDMVIHPHYRGQGMGGELIAKAIGEAKKAGCLRLTLLTDKTNINAQRFYLRHDFNESAMKTMRMILSEDE